MELNLSGSLGGKIDEMLQGSVAGDVSFITPQPEPPVLETLNVTENGTYTPPSNIDGYDEVIVNVPTPEPTLDTLNVTENGTYIPPSNIDGYDEVIVNVPTPEPAVLETLNVTENGTYTPPSNIDGYDEVIVNIPSNQYILYGEQQASESNWQNGALSLDTINYHTANRFSYDSANKKLICLASGTYCINVWGYNLQGAGSEGVIALYVNNNLIFSSIIPRTPEAVNGSNKIITLNVNDEIVIQNIYERGWAFGRIKIYDVGSNDMISFEE